MPVADPEQAAFGALRCTDDGAWCAEIVTEEEYGPATLRVFRGRLVEGATPAFTQAFGEAGQTRFTLWPQVFGGSAGRALMLGVEAAYSTGYSGGGGSSRELRLLRLTTAEGGKVEAAEVLAVMISGSIMIRACFGERDMRNRLGACHDEYDFTGTLEAVGEGDPPVLRLRTKATTYPADVRRSEDSTLSKLRKRDLVHTVDPACSYERTLTFDRANGVYAADQPLPDCSDYTAP